MDPVMRIKQYFNKNQSITRTVKMDDKNMRGVPERVGAKEKISHRNKTMGCK